ncbi:MAG TPA: serine hydrolase domain-containing protein [Labilithrix sp.]
MRRLVLAAVLVSCGEAAPAVAPAPAPPPVVVPSAAASAAPAPVASQLDADALESLASGATVPIPKGWWVTRRPDRLVLEDPDRELTITLGEIDQPTVEAGIGAMFARVGRKVPEKTARTDQNKDVAGWDEVVETVYETPPADGRVVAINARRKGARVWAALLDGKQSAFARRGAQLRQIVFGMKVPGVEDENLANATMQPLDGDRAKTFEAFVEATRVKTKTPGVAVAVVQNGKIVYEHAFGVREVGKKDPVTLKTTFMIGSVTKSMSSLLVASLVDDGKLAWDSKVKDLSSGFETGDPAFTDRLTIADTFCACTGMARRDLDMLFEFQKTKPDDVLAWFKTMKPTTAFGETFQYSNQMVAIGGFVAAHVAEPKLPLGAAYEKALEKRVLAPMGMTDTTASFDSGRKRAASPHDSSLTAQDNEQVALPFALESFVSPVAPAGAVFSTAHDMARYAQVELANGKTPEGKQVFSEANLLARRKPRVRSSAKSAYGLGLAVSDVKGLATVQHDGGTFGFVSRFFLVPDKGLALVVLTNSTSGGGQVTEATKQRLLEIVLGAKERAASDLDKAISEGNAQRAKERAKLSPSFPDATLARVVGTWETPRLGTIAITADGKNAIVDAGEWKSHAADKKTDDGTEEIVLLDGPLAGLPIRIADSELVLSFGQDVFHFKKK